MHLHAAEPFNTSALQCTSSIVSLRSDFADVVFDGVTLAGFKMLSHWHNLLTHLLTSTVLSFSSDCEASLLHSLLAMHIRLFLYFIYIDNNDNMLVELPPLCYSSSRGYNSAHLMFLATLCLQREIKTVKWKIVNMYPFKLGVSTINVFHQKKILHSEYYSSPWGLLHMSNDMSISWCNYLYRAIYILQLTVCVTKICVDLSLFKQWIYLIVKKMKNSPLLIIQFYNTNDSIIITVCNVLGNCVSTRAQSKWFKRILKTIF